MLAELGAELSLWKVNMKPGKPVAIARLGDTPYYGLPGNPVSAMVAFLLFVRPSIRTALGCAQPFDLPRATAILDGPVRAKGNRRSYLRGHATFDATGTLRVAPKPHQGSHILTSMVSANALIVLEPGPHDLSAGSPVTIQLIAPLG